MSVLLMKGNMVEKRGESGFCNLVGSNIEPCLLNIFRAVLDGV